MRKPQSFWHKRRDDGVFLLALVMYGLVAPLPFCVVRLLGRFFGNVIYFFAFPIRKLVLVNLQTAMPGRKDEHRRIARLSLQHLSMTALEMFWLSFSKKRIQKYIHRPDAAHAAFKPLFEQNKGLLLVVPHLGSWEAAGLGFSHFYGTPLYAVARVFDNRHIEKLVYKTRHRFGNHIIPSVGAVRGMLRALHDKQVLCTLIDQNTSIKKGGIFVPFFGLPVPASRAAAMAALQTGAPVAVAGCVRTPEGYDYFCRPCENLADNETEATAQIMAVIEAVVRDYPEQYLWYYHRFRFIPEDAQADCKARYPYYSRVAGDGFYGVKYRKMTEKEKNSEQKSN